MQRLRSTTSTASPFSGVPSVDDRASAALGEEAELAADAESGQEQNRVPFTRLAEEERHGTLSKGCIEGGNYLPRTRRAFVGQ